MLRPLYEVRSARPKARGLGGWRQRQAHLDEEGDDSVSTGTISRLAGGLLQDWAEGTSSASRMQFHVANAASDGMTHPMILKLASIGKGRHAQAGLRRVLAETGLEDLQTRLDVPDAGNRNYMLTFL